MPDHTSFASATLCRRKAGDLHTVALYRPARLWSKALPAQFGQETVKVIVSDCSTDTGSACWPCNGHFVLHKLLLAQHSPFFNAKFDNFIDREIVGESVEHIVSHREKFLLDAPGVPAGYSSSMIASINDWENGPDQDGATDASGATVEQVLNLPFESSEIFRVFVHWLYIQTLPSRQDHFNIADPDSLVSLYTLAERLDVPELRHQCYREIRNKYRSGELPSLSTTRIIVDGTSESSLLRKFFVKIVAHAIVAKKSKDDVDVLLEAFPDFAREIYDEVVSRVRSEEGSVDPYQDVHYAEDDSESDYESSDYESLEDEDDDRSFCESEEYEEWSEEEEIDEETDEVGMQNDSGGQALGGDIAWRGADERAFGSVDNATTQVNKPIKKEPRCEDEDQTGRPQVKRQRTMTPVSSLKSMER